MAATVVVIATAANIRCRDALPGDLVASGAGRDRHIFMTLLIVESIGESCDGCMSEGHRTVRPQEHRAFTLDIARLVLKLARAQPWTVTRRRA
jgi:hypothetical protein